MRDIYTIFIITFHGINDKIYFDANDNIGIGITNPSTNFHIGTTDGIVIPVGTSAQRVDVTGAIRFNTDNSTFEGFKGTWGSLGGIVDVDQDTYIEAESSAGADNDDLKFFTSGVERMKIDTNGNTTINSDLIVDTNLLFVDASSNLVNINGDLDIWGKARFESSASYIESGVLSLSNTLTGPVIDSTGTDIRLSSTGNTGALTINSSGNTSLTGALNMGDNNITTVKQLHLDSDSVTNKLYVTRSDNSANGFVITQSTAQVINLNQSENANMNLLTNNIVRFRLENGGDINCMSNNITNAADISFTSATIKGHMIPDTDDTYDIGSATYKIRDMYVSDNSLWVGDSHKVSISSGKMKFRKRKLSSVPAAITTAGGNETDALSHSGESSLSAMKLKHWKAYMRSLSGQSTATIQDIFRDNDDDYSEQGGADNWLENGTKTYNNIGNVGIGTNNPSEKLHIYENANDSIQLKIENGYASSRAGLTLVNDSGVFNIQCNGSSAIIENHGSGSTHFYQKGTGDYIFKTTDNNTERFIIKTGGWIGIGCSPNESLEIEDISPMLRLTDNRSDYGSSSGVVLGGIEFYSRDTSTSVDYGPVGAIKIVSDNGTVAPDGAIVFSNGTNGSLTEGMRLSSDGRLGIGTSSPNSLLTLNHTTDGSNMIEFSGSNEFGIRSNWESMEILFDADNNSSTAGKLTLRDNSSTAGSGGTAFARFSNDNFSYILGNVGIGTTSPNYKFVVNGDINLTGDLRINGVAQDFLDGTSNIETTGYIVGKQHYCDIELDGCTNTSAPDLYRNINQSQGTWRSVYLKHTRTDTSIPKVGMEYTWNRSFAYNNGFNDSNTTNTSANAPDDMFKVKCSKSGIYIVNYNLKTYSTSSGASIYGRIRVNGTGNSYAWARIWYTEAGKLEYISGSDCIYMNTNDYLEVETYCHNGTHSYNDGRLTACLIGEK